MFKKKLKELRMGNQSLENEQNKYQPIKKVNIINNQKFPDNFTKRNLPELKLSKLKSKISVETDIDVKEEGNNSLQKIKPLNNIRKPKSRSQMKNRDIIFPKIKNVFPNVNPISDNSKQSKNFPIHNLHNVYNMHNYNYNIHNIQPIPNSNNINNPINIHKIKNILPINSNPKTIPQKKLNKIKKESSETHHPYTLIPSNPNLSNINNTNLNISPSPNSNINNINSNINGAIPQNSNNQISNISSNTTNTTNTASSEMQEQMQELDMMTEKLNMLHSLFSSLTSLSGTGPSYPFFKPKTVNVTPEILTQTFQHFEESKYSELSEFSTSDFIKAYSYCTSQGNIRDYNEDTITAIKLSNNNDNFYFFAVYDGHGGNGCSIYLRDNLHKYINDFSKESIIKAIETSEDNFCKNYAVDEKNEPGDEEEKKRIELAGGKIYQTASFIPLFQNGQEIEIPWRVLPGRLSVSRTFGDIEAKDEKFGGMKNVVCALPDITEIELNDDFSFIVIGCDGIFDVLSNEELVECVKIVLNEKNNLDVNLICKECSNLIIKSSLAKDSFDNVSCIFIALNLKKVLE